MSSPIRRAEKGPFVASQIHPGDRYELSNGHPIFCAPTGASGGRANGLGFSALASDPAVAEAGVDVGYTPEEGTLLAPDVSVGNVPAKAGWVPGVPPLAVEYAGSGQDEGKLQEKITELLAGGTRHVWVVRLMGPRSVEVHEPGRPVRALTAGESLEAPGILQNAVPVEALYDEREAFKVTFRNLLQRQGYGSLEEVRAEGRDEGRASALVTVLTARGFIVDDAVRAHLEVATSAQLDAWLVRAVSAKQLQDVFEADPR